MGRTGKPQLICYFFRRFTSIIQKPLGFQNNPFLNKLGGSWVMTQVKNVGQGFRRFMHELGVKLHFMLRPEIVFEQQVKLSDYIHFVFGKTLVILGLLFSNPGYFNNEAF